MIKFEEIKLGQIIQDEDGNIGKVVKIEDAHNVHIDYFLNLRENIDGGYGILCLDPNCEYYCKDATFV